MRFGTIFATAIAGLASLVAAEETTDKANPIFNPIAGTEIKAGAPFTVQWQPTAGKFVTLVLHKGKDIKNLPVLEVIAEKLPNGGAFIWSPSSDLELGEDYSIEITSDDPETTNYSAQFKIDSKGKGLKNKTIEPSTTRTVASTALPSGEVPTFTGASAQATGTDDEDEASASAAPEANSAPNGKASLGLFGWVIAAIAAGAMIVV